MNTTRTSSRPVPYAVSHQQVEQALRPRLMQRYLSAQQGHDKHLQDACHILDAKYEPGAHCSILYQLGEQLMIGELQWNEATPGTPETANPIQPQAMQVYPFEHDPALPGLTTVQDGQKMASILNAALPECVSGEARVLRCQVTPLRYRLGKRYTLRFQFWLRDNQTGAVSARTLYGKLYHSAAKAQAVYNEMQMLAAAPTLRAGQVVLAQAVAFVPALPLVVQAPVDGVPLDLLLSLPKNPASPANPRALVGIRRAGAALATLHQVEVSTDRVRPVDAELERFQRRTARIMEVEPAVGACLNELARALPAWLEHLPARGAENRLGHGDCKPSQFFIGATQVALLDFDHCGMADPAADVGNFLATLRQMGVRQALKQRQSATGSALERRRSTAAHGTPTTNEVTQWLDMLEEQFLTAYLANDACHPDFRWRATWYQAVALLRKALRSFARSPRSPLPALLVQEAWRCLATLPAE